MQTGKALNPGRLRDESIMTFGKHKGKRMIDIPASYLKYMWDMDYAYGELKDYIKENLDVITANAKEEWE